MSSNVLSTKAKARYGNRILQDAYMELARKQTIGDVVTYLKQKSSYSEAFQDANPRIIHRQEVESILNQEYYRRCAGLLRFAPKEKKQFYYMEIMGIEINVILEKIATITTMPEEFQVNVSQYVADHASFDLRGLINVDTHKELVAFLKNTKYSFLIEGIDFDMPINFNKLNKEFMEFYYRTYFKAIKKNFSNKTKSDLLEILSMSIDLRNLAKLVRYKTYFPDEANEVILQSLFLKYSRISKESYQELLEAKSIEALYSMIKERIRYSDVSQLAPDNSIEESVAFVRYHMCRHFLYLTSDDAVAYLAYTMLAKIEIDNLIHIIEGIRYGRDGASIESLLIYS